MALSVFTFGMRKLVAQLIMQQTMFLAVGPGEPDWDEQPPPATPEEEAIQMAAMSQKSALVECVGVTRIRSKSYAKPDEAGTIVLSDGSKWSKTSDVQPYIFLEYQLDLTDATGISVREGGVYAGTQLASSVPPGQMYIPLADVVELGTLIQLHRFPPIVRDGSLSQIITPLFEM